MTNATTRFALVHAQFIDGMNVKKPASPPPVGAFFRMMRNDSPQKTL